MRNMFLTAIGFFFLTTSTFAASGVIDVASNHGVEETVERLQRILNDKGMTIFEVVDHSGGAKNAGVELRQTIMILFGNPGVGSPLMKCRQSVGIDLPRKALVWEDDSGKTWISYNNPKYLQKRHKISGCEDVLTKMEKALAGITGAAAAK